MDLYFGARECKYVILSGLTQVISIDSHTESIVIQLSFQ